MKAIPTQITIDHGGIRKQGKPNRWKTSMMENREANHNNLCDTTYYYYFPSINFGQLEGIWMQKKEWILLLYHIEFLLSHIGMSVYVWQFVIDVQLQSQSVMWRFQNKNGCQSTSTFQNKISRQLEVA